MVHLPFFIFKSNVKQNRRDNHICSTLLCETETDSWFPAPLSHRCAGAASGGGGARPSGPGSGRAEERVCGTDGDSGEAEGGKSPGTQ